MNIKKAERIVSSIVDRYIRDNYSVNANLFDLGIIRAIPTENASRARKEIRAAWELIREKLRQVC